MARKSHAPRRYSVPSIQPIFEEYDGRMVAWVVGRRRMDDVSYAPNCLDWTTCPIRTRDEAPACQNARNANPLCCSGVRLGLLGRRTDTAMSSANFPPFLAPRRKFAPGLRVCFLFSMGELYSITSHGPRCTSFCVWAWVARRKFSPSIGSRQHCGD